MRRTEKPDFKRAGDELRPKAGASRSSRATPTSSSTPRWPSRTRRDYAPAETQWRDFLKIKPSETEAMSALGSVLAEMKKYDEAAAVLHQALLLKPEGEDPAPPAGRRLLQAGNKPKSYEEMVVFIALERGTPAEDAAAAAQKAPAASDAAKLLATMGAPEELRYWEAEGQKYETWFYWQKNVAYTLQGGKQVAKSDWGAPPPKLAKPAAAPAKPAARKK